MEIEIRGATPDDRAALVSLNREWDDAGHAVDDPTTAGNALGQGSEETVWVAVVDGEPVGFATVQQTTSFRYRRPTHELTALYVAKSHRRRGVGSRLLETVRAHSEACGALELFLRVHRDNRAARRLYEQCGMALAEHRIYRDRHY